jgi:hypothetical protein
LEAISHLTALMHGRKISEEEGAKLSNDHRVARTEFSRRITRETWLIPDENRRILEKTLTELSRSNFESWDELVVHGSEIIEGATTQLRPRP